MIRTLAAAFATTICIVALATPAAAQTRQFNIPAGSLRSALDAFARQSGRQVIYRGDEVRSARSPGVRGARTAEEALDALLVGTGFTARKDASGAFAVAKLGNAPAAAETAASSEGGPESDRTADIVVTAQKRSERLLDVPAPVSAVTGATLSANNQTLLRDYATTVPGFIVSPGPSAGNQQMLVIRGIASQAFGNPTVGVTVDDVPYGAFTRELAPDIDPSDIARVEVLRGPQGTLYGANSMGGLIKFVTVDPSTDRVAGRLEAGISTVEHGDIGASLRGAVNLPASDTLALRASMFWRRDAGYVDNPRFGLKDVNDLMAYGGRFSLLWRPASNFSLKLGALFQRIESDGLSEVVVASGLTPLDQNYMRGVGRYSQETQSYSAIANWTVGDVKFTSVSGYNIYHSLTTNDYSYLLGGTAQTLFGVNGAPVTADTKTNRFTQELRATFFTGDTFEWLLGGFYSHERTPLIQAFNAADPNTGAIAGNIQALNIPIRNTEYAAFGDLTIHLGERFDVQVGGRQSFLRTYYEPVLRTGALFPTPSLLPGIRSNDNVFTYLITPRFRPSDDLMFYARFASGYRPSRGNSFNPDPSVPRTAVPDTTKNYEVGAKGKLADGALTFDVSIYRIDFNNIQILLQSPVNSLTYTTNGSAAQSEGVELSLELKPTQRLTITGWGAYTNARLTQAFPVGTAARGVARDRLPFTPRWSGNITARQDFPLGENVTGFIGGTATWLSDRLGPFVNLPARAVYPSYAKVDLRAGVEFSGVTINAYVNNLTDKRVFVGGGVGNFPPTSFVVLQPRTIGLTLAHTF